MEERTELAKRSELLEKLITRAWSDELFKAKLVKNPAVAVEEELGFKVPDVVDIKVIEETAYTRYIILPYRPAAGDELPDDELEAVAGGASSSLNDPGGASADLPCRYGSCS